MWQSWLKGKVRVQILVFVLAAVIVVVFVISGFHFVRSVYLAQLELERDRSARNFAAHVVRLCLSLFMIASFVSCFACACYLL